MNSSRSTRQRKLPPQLLFRVDAGAHLNLQRQIRQQLIEAIAGGAFAPGRRLPSSRQLAAQLGVARNTVVLACQQLIAEGHLVARERSGLYVNDEIVKGLALSKRVVTPSADAASDLDWSARIKAPAAPGDGWRCPPDWQKYPFPFVEGLFDRSLYPIVEWREATRLALGARQVQEWSTDTGDADDPMLVREICGKVLPRRGITARPDQVLLTGGAQEALHLLTEILVERGTKVGIEEPGNSAMLQLLRRRGASLAHLPVDEDGLVVARSLADCEILYVTPSHQRPTAATLSMARRAELLALARAADSIVIEDDFECETNYLDDAYPALRSLAGGERVIYVADLSRALAPGLRLGFIVASPEIVAEARALRALTARQPPLSVQRTAALFFSLGRQDDPAAGPHFPGAHDRAARCAQSLPAAIDRHRACARRHDILGAGTGRPRCAGSGALGRTARRAHRARQSLLRERCGAGECVPHERDGHCRRKDSRRRGDAVGAHPRNVGRQMARSADVEMAQRARIAQAHSGGHVSLQNRLWRTLHDRTSTQRRNDRPGRLRQ
jgi:DNA-binding transcriptional MocR family regulator